MQASFHQSNQPLIETISSENQMKSPMNSVVDSSDAARIFLAELQFQSFSIERLIKSSDESQSNDTSFLTFIRSMNRFN